MSGQLERAPRVLSFVRSMAVTMIKWTFIEADEIMLSPITRKTCHMVSIVARVCALLFLFFWKILSSCNIGMCFRLVSLVGEENWFEQKYGFTSF